MIFSMVLISISTLLLITGFLFYFFIMKIYAEMVYSSQRSFGILSYDTYKDYEYLVLSFGTHPCAYIRADKLTKKQVDYINENCHGGITFSKKSMRGNLKNIEGKWIGWDYAHSIDYTGYFPYGKKYTTEEIVSEIKSIIDKL